jgi:hypothetical protein
VTVFSTPTYPWCTRLKAYLRQYNITFQDVDVGRDTAAATHERVGVRHPLEYPIVAILLPFRRCLATAALDRHTEVESVTSVAYGGLV